MSLLLPKIVYNSITVNFTYPPVQKPAEPKKAAVRHDNFSTIGCGQFINERIDSFQSVQFDNVPLSDIAAISTFMDWALQGKPFDYYPNASSGTHTTYTLEDTDWDPKFAIKGGYYKFTMMFRKQVLPV